MINASLFSQTIYILLIIGAILLVSIMIWNYIIKPTNWIYGSNSIFSKRKLTKEINKINNENKNIEIMSDVNVSDIQNQKLIFYEKIIFTKEKVFVFSKSFPRTFMDITENDETTKFITRWGVRKLDPYFNSFIKNSSYINNKFKNIEIEFIIPCENKYLKEKVFIMDNTSFYIMNINEIALHIKNGIKLNAYNKNDSFKNYILKNKINKKNKWTGGK